MTAADHNRLLSVFYLILGCLFALGAVFSLLFGALSFINAPARGVPEMIGIVIGLLIGFTFVLVLALIPLLAALGFWKRRSWSRISGTVAAIFVFFLFPLGTALAIYTIWFVFSDKGKTFYQA